MTTKTNKPTKTSSRELVSHGELLARELQDDDFRQEWERLAFARVVAARVIGYRADHDLTQSALAKLLCVPQPQVARLENAEHEPSHSTLQRLAGKLGMEFTINFTAADRQPKQLTKSTREHLAASYEAHDSVVRFAAG